MDISVLIPLSHSAQRARACLESLESTMPKRLEYEVILVDDATTEPPRGLLDGLRDSRRHRVMRVKTPLGRAACLNAAAKTARAPVFCLLDPGTTLMPGWLEPMRRIQQGGKIVGCVGNIHREPYSGLIDDAGIVFDPDGLPVPTGHNTALLPAATSTRRPAVSAACCLVGRAVFNQIGGFNERFRQRFDDVDFCLRATQAGFVHFVANRSVVYHYPAPAPPSHAGSPEDADLALYRTLWGERALAYQRERAAPRAEAAYSPQRWEIGRESRRQHRQDLRDSRRDGRRYLKKHLLRPWHYNYGRICGALVQFTHPVPPAIPRPPAFIADGSNSAAQGSDAMLFDPPPR